MANDSDSLDESLGGFTSGDDDPFSFQQRKFTGSKKPLPSSTGNDSDSSTSSRSSSPPARKARGRKGTKKAAPKGRAKRKGNDDVDRKIEMLRRRRHRSTIDLDTSSSDSSSSDEDKENRKKSAARRSVGRGKRKGSKPVPACIDLSSDSSEDESDRPQLSLASTASTNTSTTKRTTRAAARAAAAAATLDSGSPSKRKKSDLKDASKDTVDALKEARRAAEALKEAQKYKAEDVSFEQDGGDDDDVVCVDDDSALNSSFEVVSPGVAIGSKAEGATSSGLQASILEAPTGVPLRLNVRVVLSTGKSTDSDGKKAMCKIRTGEKLQQLVDQLRKSCPHVASFCDVKFSFDGQTLNLDKTPAFYDMEDEDLVDAIVQTSSASGKVSAARSLKSSARDVSTANESRVKIRTRIKGGDPRRVYEFLMRKTDPLQKLIDAYGKQHRESGAFQSGCSVHLEYNGRSLKPSSTPENEGVIDNTMLEISDEAERQLQLRRVSRAAASSPQPGQITLKCRINGKNIQTYCILPTDKFEVLINEFCSRNGVKNTDCTFNFDGEQLRTNHTPLQLDLEGDEIIEVLVSESVLASALVATSAGSSNMSSSDSAPASRPPSAWSAGSSSGSILENFFNPSGSSRGTSSLRSASSSTSNRTTSIISIQVMRNNDSMKLKKFKLYTTDKIEKLNFGYKKYYKKKGCRRVEFYVNGSKVNKDVTFESLGLRDMSVLVAMENGRKLNA